MKEKKKSINKKGFTLIELLAIIAIMAIVLGVGTYGIVTLVKKSKDNASLISENSIKETANIYADEASDSLWIDPDGGDYKYYCVTIDELINKGLIKKNAKLPSNISKNNYISVKKNKVTLVKNESVILNDDTDVNSSEYQVCTGNRFEENVSKIPEITGNKSWTDSLEINFNDGKAESDIKDKWCQYDTTSSINKDDNIVVLDSKANTCSIDRNLINNTAYYVRVCMTTVGGSKICSATNSYNTADFVNPEFSVKDDTITITYKDDNIKEARHYFKSNINCTSDKNVSECVFGSDNKFTCDGSTSDIVKDKWYKVNENGIKITYNDNEIKNGNITARIMDGTGNYKDNDKKFNLYRIVFKKSNADKINNSANDITNICLNDIDKKCSIKSPSISKSDYTVVGWNTDSSANNSIWNVNTSLDIDGSNTYYPIIRSRVNIKLNANGGDVTKETSKGGKYTIDSSGIISRNGKNVFHTINYGEKMNSSGLANYNNQNYLYITKKGTIVTKNEEWICLSGCTTIGKVYSQYEVYSADDFCDAKEKSCTVVLGVNWKDENYTLTYDNNGGSGCASKSMTYGGKYGSLCTPSRRGYAFVGWFDNDYKNNPLNYYADTYSDLKNAFGYDANLLYKHYFEYGLKEGRRISQYISSDIYNIEGNETIYAGWKNIVYKINYNANGGSGTMESDNAEFGTNVTIKNNGFTRDGYTFVGWTTNSSGSADGYNWTGWSGSWSYVDGQYGIAENKLELYAMWKKNSVYIKLNANGGNVTQETSKGGKYATDSSGIISRNGNGVFHTISYGGSLGTDGLANYDNVNYLYITKNGFTTNKNKEWICLSGCTTSGKVYSQYEVYSADDFCDTKERNCTVVLGVNWVEKYYTISYNANGGSGTISSDTISTGSKTTIKDNTFTRSGYTFAGWTTNSNGSDDGYGWTGWSGTWNYDNGQYGINNNKLVLYARWTPKSYTISYNPGYIDLNTCYDSCKSARDQVSCADKCDETTDTRDAGKMSSDTISAGMTVTIKNNTFVRDGYTFVGWTTNSDGTDDGYGWTNWSGTWNYDNGQYGIYGNKLILYARWALKTYTISYNANGGSNAPGSQSKSGNSSISLSSDKPSRTGYTFAGWNTKSDGSGTTYKAGTSYKDNADLTLYAQWKINEVHIRLRLNGGTNASTNTSYGTSGDYITYNGSTNIHTISYGGMMDSDGLLNYNNSAYLNIKRTGYTASVGAEWKCMNSNCKKTTYSQTTQYSASDFCDSSGGSCTVDLGVNWVATKMDTINGNRCSGNNKYYITTCDASSCNYTKLNNNTASGTVARNTLSMCSTKTVYVTAPSGLYCRSAANTSGTQIALYSCGTQLTVDSIVFSGWYYATVDSCYVMGDYVSTTKPSCSSSGGGSSCKTIVTCLGAATGYEACLSLAKAAGGTYSRNNPYGDCYATFCNSCPSGWIKDS